MQRYIIGVDEAGRGPLAGPVAVAVVMVPEGFRWQRIPGVDDSKKLSEKKREKIFAIAKKLKKEEKIDYRVALVGASVIDKVGITRAVACGVNSTVKRLTGSGGSDVAEEAIYIKLDGLLHAPARFKDQQTIIKGDQKERVIGLASILAKVTRDRHMIRLSKKHPAYGFDVHKGYGTARHQKIIQKKGLCDIHRKSFCSRNVP